MITDPSQPNIVGDCPASFHQGPGISYADGHAGVHVWQNFAKANFPVMHQTFPYYSVGLGAADDQWA